VPNGIGSSMTWTETAVLDTIQEDMVQENGLMQQEGLISSDNGSHSTSSTISTPEVNTFAIEHEQQQGGGGGGAGGGNGGEGSVGMTMNDINIVNHGDGRENTMSSDNGILMGRSALSNNSSSQLQQTNGIGSQLPNVASVPARRRLLLVDDNDFCLDVTEMQISNFLEKEGYSFVDVETCSADVLQHLCENVDYDFVMMDLNFPGTPEMSSMLPGAFI
jgi:CheY-like chemotaxis protein